MWSRYRNFRTQWEDDKQAVVEGRIYSVYAFGGDPCRCTSSSHRKNMFTLCIRVFNATTLTWHTVKQEEHCLFTDRLNYDFGAFEWRGSLWIFVAAIGRYRDLYPEADNPEPVLFQYDPLTDTTTKMSVTGGKMLGHMALLGFDCTADGDKLYVFGDASYPNFLVLDLPTLRTELRVLRPSSYSQKGRYGKHFVINSAVYYVDYEWNCTGKFISMDVYDLDSGESLNSYPLQLRQPFGRFILSAFPAFLIDKSTILVTSSSNNTRTETVKDIWAFDAPKKEWYKYETLKAPIADCTTKLYVNGTDILLFGCNEKIGGRTAAAPATAECNSWLHKMSRPFDTYRICHWDVAEVRVWSRLPRLSTFAMSAALRNGLDTSVLPYDYRIECLEYRGLWPDLPPIKRVNEKKLVKRVKERYASACVNQ